MAGLYEVVARLGGSERIAAAQTILEGLEKGAYTPEDVVVCGSLTSKTGVDFVAINLLYCE